MFLQNQDKTEKEYYEKILKAACALSNLFSNSFEPYLGYRLVENLFCKSFNAENLSRFDCSVDATKDGIGIGLKTFGYRNGKGYEKVAEFNSELNLFNKLKPEQMVKKVSELRNERINFTKRNYKITDTIYHNVVRKKGKIEIYESPMDTININKISKLDSKKNIINFKDDLNYYKFNTSKSTLYKQFVSDKPLMEFDVKIITDPFKELERMFQSSASNLVFAPLQEKLHVFLPLYSGSEGEKFVPEKSGLNQWNASGRPRNANEIYIAIPKWIHKSFPNFFPGRDLSFNLVLPDKQVLNAKVCQENSKALMTNPNSKLGEWILRQILELKERELLTYEKLETLGLDSVVIYKNSDSEYEINFSKIGYYDEFKNLYKKD